TMPRFAAARAHGAGVKRNEFHSILLVQHGDGWWFQVTHAKPLFWYPESMSDASMIISYTLGHGSGSLEMEIRVDPQEYEESEVAEHHHAPEHAFPKGDIGVGEPGTDGAGNDAGPDQSEPEEAYDEDAKRNPEARPAIADRTHRAAIDPWQRREQQDRSCHRQHAPECRPPERRNHPQDRVERREVPHGLDVRGRDQRIRRHEIVVLEEPAADDGRKKDDGGTERDEDTRGEE